MTGLIGFASGYHAMETVTRCLMLGTDFPRQFYPRTPASPSTQGGGDRTAAPVELGVVGQVGPTLRALLPRLTVRKRPQASRHLDAQLRRGAKRARRAGDRRAGGPLHPQHIAASSLRAR